MPLTAAKGAKKKADDEFSRLVRARGACERCGESRYAQLQTAHIISRRYSHTRTDLANAFCLCAKDHAYFTANPVEFAAFVLQQRGEEGYERLLRKSQRRTKVDWLAELTILRTIGTARFGEMLEGDGA